MRDTIRYIVESNRDEFDSSSVEERRELLDVAFHACGATVEHDIPGPLCARITMPKEGERQAIVEYGGDMVRVLTV
ncbi:hypothetical protein [Geothrix sp. 21YS21S-2]|uniref:hypothetical protein n=1 Tax=Geothrix sp. 21YS21S-2 TaxID=3068893 RepID=UPI0027B9F1CF|nr:hypothetical protein [Geothrix sp. 21YS21S-2]